MTKLDELIRKSSQGKSKSNLLNKLVLVIGVAAIILLVVASVWLFLPKPVSNEKAAKLAQCLSSKGIKLYGAYYCGACKSQKELFGDAFQFVSYVECVPNDVPNQQCIDAGIESFPTWIINGEKYGYKTLEELASLSGCTLN